MTKEAHGNDRETLTAPVKEIEVCICCDSAYVWIKTTIEQMLNRTENE